MKITKNMRRVFAIFTSFLLVFSNFSFTFAAETAATEDSALLSGTDFEDGDTWGFSPGGGATAEVIEENNNKYLKTTGNGSGTRSIIKTLDEPTNNAEVTFTFDWKPEEVQTPLNSSQISLSDTNGDPFFRIVKAGGEAGEIKYGFGTKGTDLSNDVAVTDVSTDGSWLSVEVVFDFNTESASLTIEDRDDETKSFSTTDIDFSHLNYVNKIEKFSIVGNRASGNNLIFITGLDNVTIAGSSEAAPSQAEQNIETIVSTYNTEFTIPKNVAKEEVITLFPSALAVKLGNDVVITVDVEWDSVDYDATENGTYSFTGTLITEGIPNVVNGNNVNASVSVIVAEAAAIPEIDGYEGVYYSDFGDTVEVVPVNWGFTTAAATLSINKDDIAGNTTPKLQYSIVDQSGGRVATKKFDSAVKGTEMLVKFDWYPGKINDKGSNPSENGAEFRLIDSSGNIVFTLNNTNNSPLTYFAGSQVPTETGITEPDAWYEIEVLLDLIGNEVTLTLKNEDLGINEDYTSSLEGVAFDGSLETLRFVGLRTSGNNHTWTTYLDNIGIYSVPISDNIITRVDRLSYHRIYVNEATESIQSIGLPETVTVTLADNSKAEIEIAEWTEVGASWNPSEAGVYEFEGTLVETEGILNDFDRSAKIYVYNRLTPPNNARQTEWLNRSVLALNSEDGIFVSWRLLADEYVKDVTFNVYRDGEKLNEEPLSVTNFVDAEGTPGETYTVETLVNGNVTEENEVVAISEDYLSIPMQKPEGGTTATGDYTYTVNDSGVGDLDGDGEYEIIVKWYPTNSIDSSQQGMTGPTIFDAYKLDGTLLWRINMGHNLTSGAHYHQFVIADFDGNGKSEFLIKTADATTSYGTTDGEFDSEKILSVIGNAEDDGIWVNDSGHVFGGPEYISVFNGETGEVIDTIDYAFPVEKVEGDGGASWGDTWYNRSDRFLSGLAYLDGEKPSAIYGRGYYARTTFVAYNLVDGKLEEEWTFDSDEEGRGGGLGFHSLATGDVDNDGFDEIIAGSLTLNHDGSILYAMDGEMGRELGSHGDALHVGAFDPDREGLHIFGVHEEPAVASVELHDGATGETIMSYYASVDAGRGIAANITSNPGYEFWGTGGHTPETGGGIYNVQGNLVADSFRDAGLSVNFRVYWTGDLLDELLDDTEITKYNEETGRSELVRKFEGVVSNNGTKATPTLSADILGDWREEVLLPTTDSTELRIYSTTIPTEYRLYTLMHDTVYRMGIAWQNSAYNQPPHLGFYLGEDIRETVLAGELHAPNVAYTNEPSDELPTPTPRPTPISGDKPGQVIVDNNVVTVERLTTEDGKIKVVTKVNKDRMNQWIAGQDSLDKVIVKVKKNAGEVSEVKIPASIFTKLGEENKQAIIEIESEEGVYRLPVSEIDSATLAAELGAGRVEDVEISIMVNEVTGEQASVEGNGLKTASKAVEFTVYASGSGKQVEVKNFNSYVERSIIGENDFNPSRSIVVRLEEDGSFTPVPTVFEGNVASFKSKSNSTYVVVENEVNFSDVPTNHWAKGYIDELAAKYILQGSNGKAMPQDAITRAELAAVLTRSLALETTSEYAGQFTDVTGDEWFVAELVAAVEAGLIKGHSNGSFAPNADVTREEAATMISRAMNLVSYDENSLDTTKSFDEFTDSSGVASWAQTDVSLLVQADIINGRPNGKFAPKGTMQRAELAKALSHFLTFVELKN
ncbi:S-layer homology domain-containing protein [Evansella sp. AB-rgal1]|uniref:rhamnogalacturonan lyase family protein n=1 Tax=Evansella sp. AB-rgal1 TaxID=3242696 RepID=UPI00359D310A